MRSGPKSLRSFHIHGKKHEFRDVPKGCLATKVGQGEDDLQGFVVPLINFNHPLFLLLLKEAEEEFSFGQKGTITIPCHIEEFWSVHDMIDWEWSRDHQGHGGCFSFLPLLPKLVRKN